MFLSFVLHAYLGKDSRIVVVIIVVILAPDCVLREVLLQATQGRGFTICRWEYMSGKRRTCIPASAMDLVCGH